ncbi:MAG: hypothetical protein K8R48_07895 [Alphaproteobacteria bacterium]|nr:hypothetical protein [Alphaproteobacteria bacterium]
MTNRKTRKEINTVIRKYLGYSNLTSLKFNGIVYGSLVAFGMAIDLLATGGLFSVGTATLGGLGSAGGLISSADSLIVNRKKPRTNAAGQAFECAADVHDTLEKMESRLRDSFKKAAPQGAAGRYKEDFLLLAAEVEQDAQKLSPAFKIVAGAPQDKYEFILDAGKRVTLAQACTDMKQALAQKKQTLYEKKLEDLNALIHDLENTDVIKSKKKPPRP